MPSLVPVVNSFEDPHFAWLNHPEEWTTDSSVVDEETEGAGGKIHRISSSELVFQPPAKKDFWARTFYTPLLLKHDASAFLYPIPGDVEATVSVKFSFNAIEQFDQAGLFIYVDNDHWVKCGIEFCDSLPRLSVVVCNGGFSDWSTQVWSSTSAYLKVHKVLQSSSLMVEAAPVEAQDDASNVAYQFVRIAHLGAPSSDFKADDVSTFPVWRVGPFAACSLAQRGCTARFEQFSIGPRQAGSHASDL